jgi:hypothetical protein
MFSVQYTLFSVTGPSILVAPAGAAGSQPQPSAVSAMTIVWKIANAVAAVTAFVPAKLPVAMTRLTPTLRTAVAMVMAVRFSRPRPNLQFLGENRHTKLARIEAYLAFGLGREI